MLIVDDNEKNLKLTRDVLRLPGSGRSRQRTGADGDRARRPSTVPDVVLMDLRLPDMDGTDAARMLAERDADGSGSRSSR